MWGSERHVSDADLVFLLQGGSESRRARRCRQHIEECEECRDRLNGMQAPLQEFFAARRQILDEALPPPESARHQLRAALARAVAEGSGQLSQPARRLSATLATVALAIACGAGGILWYSGNAAVDGPSVATLRAVPDSRLTPGRTGPASSVELCAPDRPAVPVTVDRQVALAVFRAHGIETPQPLAYELDHLVPPELGGVTVPENLWPQPYEGSVWDANAKDALEDRLVRKTCSGEISLRAAQADIARDWVAAYRKHFQTEKPLVEHAAFLKDQPWE